MRRRFGQGLSEDKREYRGLGVPNGVVYAGRWTYTPFAPFVTPQSALQHLSPSNSASTYGTLPNIGLGTTLNRNLFNGFQGSLFQFQQILLQPGSVVNFNCYSGVVANDPGNDELA